MIYINSEENEISREKTSVFLERQGHSHVLNLIGEPYPVDSLNEIVYSFFTSETTHEQISNLTKNTLV